MLVLVASIAVSLAIATLASLGLLDLKIWSWPACAAVLALVILGGHCAPSRSSASDDPRDLASPSSQQKKP